MGATRTNGGASTPPLSLALSVIPDLAKTKVIAETIVCKTKMLEKEDA